MLEISHDSAVRKVFPVRLSLRAFLSWGREKMDWGMVRNPFVGIHWNLLGSIPILLWMTITSTPQIPHIPHIPQVGPNVVPPASLKTSIANVGAQPAPALGESAGHHVAWQVPNDGFTG